LIWALCDNSCPIQTPFSVKRKKVKKRVDKERKNAIITPANKTAQTYEKD
jgi:hypothetical protein